MLKIKSRLRCNTSRLRATTLLQTDNLWIPKKDGVRKSYYPEYMKRGYTQPPFCCVPCVVNIFSFRVAVVIISRLNLRRFSSTRCLMTADILSINKPDSVAACSFPLNRLSFGSSRASFTVSLMVDRDILNIKRCKWLHAEEHCCKVHILQLLSVVRIYFCQCYCFPIISSQPASDLLFLRRKSFICH